MKDSKRAHYDSGFSNSKSGGGNGHFYQGQGTNMRVANDRVPHPKAQVEGGPTRPRYDNCLKNYPSMCLRDSCTIYGCGEMGH